MGIIIIISFNFFPKKLFPAYIFSILILKIQIKKGATLFKVFFCDELCANYKEEYRNVLKKKNKTTFPQIINLIKANVQISCKIT